MRAVFRRIDLVLWLAIIATVWQAASALWWLAATAALCTTWLVLVLLRVLYAVFEVQRAVETLPERVGQAAASKLVASMTPPDLQP
jgi:signal transduction histidine kinase